MYDIFDLDRYGYYVTSDRQKFYNKLECMLYCGSRGLEFEFIFNDRYYDQINWSVEPIPSITELYARRARELREKYDYLILHLSGGNDSGAILETFMINDIKLDEVSMVCPEIITNPDPNDRSAANAYAEVALCAVPNAKFVKEKFQPDLKITVTELKKLSIEKMSDGDWFINNSVSDLDPGGKFRSHINHLNNRYRSMTDQGKTVAHIDGEDKPHLVMRGSTVSVIFDDETILRRNPDRSNKNDVSLVEHFFWGPSSGEMICKQAHMILKKLNSMPNARSVAQQLMTNNGSRPVQDWIADIIYPHRVLPKWDTNKSNHIIMREWHQWFFKDQQSDFFTKWKVGMDYLNTILPEKYIKKDRNVYAGGYKPKFSKLYQIGQLKN